ncbi:MAG: hypothetical protein IPN17_28240 [Deltaproteobacteria bacterium]|nr:hypothetical protein [Deltaproteobacteria bacterium]
MSATIEWVDGTGNTLLVELDATPTQAWESTAEVTKHPVETGSAIGDHAARQRHDHGRGDSHQHPGDRPGDADAGRHARPGTLDLPGGGSVSVQRWSGPFDRVSECRELLRSLVKAGLPATLSTGRREGLRFDDNLVLVRFRVDRDATTGNSINVSLDFEQLRVVSTSRVAVPAVRRLQVPESRGTAPPVPAGSAAYNYVVGG